MRRVSSALLLLIAILTIPACGVAESVAGKFTDTNESVTLTARLDRSGTLLRTAAGGDVAVEPGMFFAGDTLTNHQALTVLGFPIDSSQQPSQTSLDSVTLMVWVEPQAGDAAELGDAILSHLPGHPDAPLALGVVPNPPGSTVVTAPTDATSGWRSFDVTAQVRQDWDAGRLITAFAYRLTTPTDSDVQRDTVATEGADGGGGALRAHIILNFSLDL